MTANKLTVLFLAAFLATGVPPTTWGQEAICRKTEPDAINTFTAVGSAPVGSITLIHLQHNTTRQLAITSTVVYDSMNLEKNIPRYDTFQEVNCPELVGAQQNCSITFRMTNAQIETVGGEYSTWDRGHMTPVNPMRFSADALNSTFYCPNNAPQEPWTNRCPWYAVEERTLNRTLTHSAYIMTGLCAANDDQDGLTGAGLMVPLCYWKMTCYTDPRSGVTRVVSFIADNTLIPFESKDTARPARTAATTRPRSQNDVLAVMGSQGIYIERAWEAASTVLAEGRQSGELPTAQSCFAARTLPQDVFDEWDAFMKLHVPPGSDC